MMVIFVMKWKGNLLSLLVKYGGMGIVIFCDSAKIDCNKSRAVIASLAKLQLEQNTICSLYSLYREDTKTQKANIKLEKLQKK